MSSEHATMAKVRARIRRELAEAEDSEHEGGEINLVPYLDIITNTVIFMLATTALSLALGNINVSAPRYAEGGGGGSSDDEEQARLNLTVGITYTGFTIGGSAAILPKIPCTAPLRNGRCPVFVASRTNAQGEKETYWVDKYDYRTLAIKLKEIKLFKDGDVHKYRHERQAVITADRRIPYNVVVRTMDTLRGVATAKCTGDDGCLFDQVILSAGVQ